MKKWNLPFRPRFNLVTLFLAIGLVAVVSDHATNSREPLIDRNLKAHLASEKNKTATRSSIQQPILEEAQTEPHCVQQQINQRFTAQASLRSAVVNY